jgi:tRNA(Ile)-lysidine synthase
MLSAFQKDLSTLEPVLAGKRFLLAISGGLDSVVMAELFKLAGCSYSIAHCNFQLRGKEADEDLKFVKTLAAKSKVPFFCVAFNTEKFCSENKLSVQMGARQLRYEWLEEIRQTNKLDYIVTAHHADDAIETFFINLLRGTGISGLHGIKAKHENTIRPLLNFYRKEIESFAKENKLKWREDSSNETDKYERNKIRHHLLPALETINSKAKESITATIETIGRTELMLSDSVEKAISKFIKTEEERVLIHFNLFKELTPSVEYLYETIKRWGFNYEQCKQITECVKGQSGKIFLSDTHQIVIDRENLIIEPKILKHENAIYEITKELEGLSTATYRYLFSRHKNKADFKIPTEAENAALDLDKLNFPLKMRKWQAGDRFYPLGMNKPKKVSDFLIDNKVSASDKEHVYVLVSGEDIAWLIGYRTDDRFKITKGTKNIYLCKSLKQSLHE